MGKLMKELQFYRRFKAFNARYAYIYVMLASKLVCKTCSEASDLITDAESGEIICTNCGMVNSNDKALQLNTAE
ncbi:MAG: TFIIB-type zinc ribbon-containing protein, partial [Nitrososphaeraceae archaeon]